MSMTPDEKIAVIQADKEGKPIQFRAKPDDKSGDPGFKAALHHYGRKWRNPEEDFYGSQTSEFNFAHYDFRVKPGGAK